jgi:acyl carrier protein
MDDTLLDLGFDSLDRATLAMRLEDDLALEIAEEDRDAAWADVTAGDMTLGQLIEKVEAMAGG